MVDIAPSGDWLLIIAISGAEYSICLDSCLSSSEKKHGSSGFGIYTMVVIKWSENVEGYGDNIYSPLCGGLYKEEDNSLATW